MLVILFFLQSNDTTTENLETENTWLTSNAFAQSPTTVTNHQPLLTGNGLNDAADSYFDFDIPNSPAEDVEYARLIENTTSTTTPRESAPESGYICASPISSIDASVIVEHSDSSSTDEPYFDPENSDIDQRSLSQSIDYYDCDDLKKDEPILNTLQRNNYNGFDSSSTESLPKSQSTTISTFTANTSESINTIGLDLDIPDFCDTTTQALSSSDLIESNLECRSNTNNDNALHTDNNQIDSKFDGTNSISKNELIDGIIETHETDNKPIITENVKDTSAVKSFLNGHSSYNEIDDDETPPRERFRRCSSLKTGKTPPGTPGRKKIVRFADVLGLDLADVRTFLDEIPKIPKSAYDELQTSHEPEQLISLGQRLDKIIVPLFQQPGSLPHFLDSVQLQNVALENAAVTDPICLTISGLVRVRNLDFHKSVHVRYTLDA